MSYFDIKLNSNEFSNHLLKLIEQLKNKKVLLYGAGKGFIRLNSIYNLVKILDIVAIADKKFENSNYNYSQEEIQALDGLKKILPLQIPNEEFDVILVTNEAYKSIVSMLVISLGINIDKIETVFYENSYNEIPIMNMLYKHGITKRLPKIIKTCKNKTVVLYSKREVLNVLKTNFDILDLNIVGIGDYGEYDYKREYCGYKVCTDEEIIKLHPDIILLLSVPNCALYGTLKFKHLKGLKTKYISLVKNTFLETIKELVCN